MRNVLLALMLLVAVSEFPMAPPAQAQSTQVVPGQRTRLPDKPPAVQPAQRGPNAIPVRDRNAKSSTKPVGDVPTIDLGEVWKRLLASEQKSKQLETELAYVKSVQARQASELNNRMNEMLGSIKIAYDNGRKTNVALIRLCDTLSKNMGLKDILAEAARINDGINCQEAHQMK